ncbi:MAG: hypothetical protein A2521_00935 [Deltaproteobacteria bacterium RIFOXYD12_FULL_57_12]|nr:MAG: hypothetical protein A2521_00935 [Deltaproteobacteria bacterium RIFOXYD12_FULL_57_12]
MATANRSLQRLLFLGDSMIEYYDWQQRFPGRTVRNLGIAGETVEELLGRMPRILAEPPPDLILIMTATNNVAMEDQGFGIAYGVILDYLRKGFPQAVLVVNSLLPFTLPWLGPAAASTANEILRNLAQEKQAVYFDVFPKFVDSSGAARREYFLDDGVHLCEAGYLAWAEEIAALLERLAVTERHYKGVEG